MKQEAVSQSKHDDEFSEEAAWKTFTLVNDWIRHAETKLAATLATSGVAGLALTNLLGEAVGAHPWTVAAAWACAILLICAGISGALGLVPRLKVPEKKQKLSSPLFFRHIATHASSASYQAAVNDLARGQLRNEVVSQIHSNSRVAARKYFWGHVALYSLALGLVALALVAASLQIL